ncbi:transporter [Croceicoccus estronivorus]|uniref:DMT family transporter n=1 Tax=Croceicoccus estronivorus TaxID=1172626 RepID=UPI000832B90C|nr:DMT family transporter [Croceicoccus estronivorus]OCC22703.1 transporter [Croceicoccus estronivorus]
MPAVPQQRPILALAIRIAAVVMLSTMIAMVKLVGERGVHLLETMFWRQFLTVPLLLAFLAMRGSLSRLRTTRVQHHFRRAMIGMTGMAMTFGAALLLPLAEAQALQFTAPLFATILSVFLLHEKVGAWRLSALILGFTGILIITQPGQVDIPLLGLAVGLGSAFAIALLSILVKDLNRSEEPLTIVFYFAAFTSPILALSLPFVSVAHDATTWILLMLMGLCGFAGQILLTMSLRFGSVSSVIVMDYSGLVWSTLYGALLFDQFPPAATWIGAPLIITAGLVIAWREHSQVRATIRAETMLGR